MARIVPSNKQCLVCLHISGVQKSLVSVSKSNKKLISMDMNMLAPRTKKSGFARKNTDFCVNESQGGNYSVNELHRSIAQTGSPHN